MKILFSCSVVFLLLFSSVHAKHKLSVIPDTILDFTIDGFRGLKWNEPLSKHVSNLVAFDQGKNVKLFTRKNDTLSIGDATLTKLIYSFVDDKFVGVMIYTVESNNRTAIIHELQLFFSDKVRKPVNIDWFMDWRTRQVLGSIACSRTYYCQIFFGQKRK